MTKHIGKPNRHEKVAQVLLSGKVVTPDEIRAVFTGTDQEGVMYRLSTNLYNIKKDGGVLKTFKDGRKVVGYQLLNADHFGKNGRYYGPPKRKAIPVAPAVVVAPAVEPEKEAELV